MYAHPSHARPAPPDLIIGETNFRNRHIRFGIREADRTRHLYVIGKTGTGKSTLLANLIHQDLLAGHGLAVVDPHGELVATALAQVPPDRRHHVIHLSPADRPHPLAWNLFRAGKLPHPDIPRFVSAVVGLLRTHWADSWGPRLEHVLRNALLAVAPHPRATLLLVYRFLTEPALRGRLVSRVVDPLVRTFWTREFATYTKSLQAEAVAPILNKLGAFLSNPTTRLLFSAERSRVDFGALIRNQGVLLADLSTAAVGKDASQLVGALLLAELQLAAMGRGTTGSPFYVYVDEFQNFATDALATTLAEARKFGLGLTLAHQYMGQLPESLRAAVRGNVGSMIAFRLGAEDSLELLQEFSPSFSSHDISHLGRHQIAVKLLVDGMNLPPFSARTLAPAALPADADRRRDATIAASRARFTRPRSKVEAHLARGLPTTIGV